MRKPLTYFTLNSLDAISNNIQGAVKNASNSITGLLKGIFDSFIVPIAGIVVLLRIFFVVMSIVKSKRKRDGENLEELTMELLIDIVVFLVIAGYSAFAWGIL